MGREVGAVVSVGVEADLDAVRVAQTDDHGSAAMTLDDLVCFTKLIECDAPSLDVVASGNQQRDGVESGQSTGPVGIVSQRDLRLASVAADRDALDLAVLDELDLGLEPQGPLVPGTAAGYVADRELDVVNAGDHAVSHFL